MSKYEQLVKALRCKALSKQCDSCKYGYHLCPDSECNDACHVEQIYADAAAAIEELQAELAGSKDAIRILKHNLEMKKPKRGEWIRVQEVDIPGKMHPAAFKCMCSVCRNEYLFPRIPRYCPDCGSMNTAKMEVQDG